MANAMTDSSDILVWCSSVQHEALIPERLSSRIRIHVARPAVCVDSGSQASASNYHCAGISTYFTIVQSYNDRGTID